jgi:hypothetical protein
MDMLSSTERGLTVRSQRSNLCWDSRSADPVTVGVAYLQTDAMAPGFQEYWMRLAGRRSLRRETPDSRTHRAVLCPHQPPGWRHRKLRLAPILPAWHWLELPFCRLPRPLSRYREAIREHRAPPHPAAYAEWPWCGSPPCRLNLVPGLASS